VVAAGPGFQVVVAVVVVPVDVVAREGAAAKAVARVWPS